MLNTFNKEEAMDRVVVTYLAYTLVSLLLTGWVARTLFRHGSLFLVDVFAGDERMAKAVNHLLVVGFWLVNLGYVAFALRIGGAVPDARTAVESLATQLGGVLLVLGAMHFANLFVLSRIRRSRARTSPAGPPVAPSGRTSWAGAPVAPVTGPTGHPGAYQGGRPGTTEPPR